MTVLDPDGSLDTYELEPGNAYFIPRAYPHHIEIVGNQVVRGRNHGGRGGQYFVAEFSRPFAGFGTFHQNQPQLDGPRVRRDDVIEPGSRTGTGSYAGTFLGAAAMQRGYK